MIVFNSTGTNQESLPLINTGYGSVNCMNFPCFLAGDSRVNEQASLTVMHTLWVREHNRIARALRANSPSMSSDDVFETARSIVIAEIQKITYTDYLPLLLGSFSSRLIPSYTRYDPSVFPNVPNAFAAAAYRFGHSQIQPFFERLGKDYKPIPAGPLSLVDAFFNNTHFMDNGGTDPILRGLLATPARQVDEFLNNVLTNMLFASNSSSPGMDLASLNIQRGRDHGLPTYLVWKQWAKRKCNIESDFRNQLTQIRLLQTYGSLNNVDLFVGGLAEAPITGGVVGATFACIFAKTFLALRDGDRFYFENSASDTAPFTAAQRFQIRRASLSRVICDNTDIKEIQVNAFMANQRRVPCSHVRSVSLTPWRIAKYCFVKVHNQNKRNRVTIVSRFEKSRRYIISRQYIGAGSNSCLPFLCPTQDRNVELYLFNSRQCALNSFTSGMHSQRNIKEAYLRVLTTADIVSRDRGLYTSAKNCTRGIYAGILIACNKNKAETNSMEEMEHPENNVNFIDEDELKRSISEDVAPEHLKSILGGSHSVEQDSLVGMMEEELLNLDGKEQKTIQGDNDEDKDQSMMKELEDALSKM